MEICWTNYAKLGWRNAAWVAVVRIDYVYGISEH